MFLDGQTFLILYEIILKICFFCKSMISMKLIIVQRIFIQYSPYYTIYIRERSNVKDGITAAFGYNSKTVDI